MPFKNVGGFLSGNRLFSIAVFFKYYLGIYYFYDLFVENIKLVQILDYRLYMTMIQFIH